MQDQNIPSTFFQLTTAQDMLEKAKRELRRLEADTDIDNVYNFYVTAYHIQDYVRIGNPSRIPELEKFLSQQDLVDCRNICNKGKHLILTRHPDPKTIVYDHALSGNTPMGSMELSGGDEWILITAENRHIDVINLARIIIKRWENFLI
ncbi:hypothetical protein [Acidovorax sp. NCPPB 4044]|uniref:hypothetical protein n=1 Tax=Acidovorax sp. NCPPB 4044 TaxID=2940490 RepID=UPI002302B19B|nr:hypothetical protein [Acidovorax sp. NCPPB 4044]MDA8519609.1 hypothetical protein [Acidovorax sp. NCPPB 4044]